MLNPAPALDLDDEILSKVDICLPNEVEAGTLADMKVQDAASAVDAAKNLLGRGCRAVVVTLGAKGAVYVDRDRVLEVPALAVPVVDTVAAGDAFCGRVREFAGQWRRPRDLSLPRLSRRRIGRRRSGRDTVFAEVGSRRRTPHAAGTLQLKSASSPSRSSACNCHFVVPARIGGST